MSAAESVARIPMARPEQEQAGASVLVKRSRSEDDSVSRTPSPPPDDSIDSYDDDTHQVPSEVVTVETKIKSTNKGFAMLAKLGWTEGQPLGLSGDGRVDPIPFRIKNDLTGLGKINQDVRMIETTVSQRRELDSERQRKETHDQRKAREDIVAKRAAVKSEIIDTLRPFYCTLCEKQFQNVAQYDEHTNSYAHHHRARLRDMQSNARLVNQGELEKRKEKERKREEKELRKLARAQGIKMAKPVAATPTPALAEIETSPANEAKPAGFKNAGWSAVTTSPKYLDIESKRSGWTTVSPVPPPLPPQAPPDDPAPVPPPPVSRPREVFRAPMFRAGGWTSLDSSGPRSVPPPASLPPQSPPLAADVPPHSSLPSHHDSHGHVSVSSLNALPPARQSWAPILDSHSSPPPIAPTKSGWQQWKQGNGSKRK